MMDDVRPKVDFAVPNGRITLSDFAGEGAPQGLSSPQFAPSICPLKKIIHTQYKYGWT